MPIKKREEYNNYIRNWRREKKEKLIMELGGKCENCNDKRIKFLGISKGKVLCFNCRDFLKRKRVDAKRLGIKK